MGHSDQEATWEPSTALSAALVADYEVGVLKEAKMQSQMTYGHTSTTLVMKDASLQPSAKRARKEGEQDESG